MNDNFENNNQFSENYDTYGFSTPIDPAPIEPDQMEGAASDSQTAATESVSAQAVEPEPVKTESFENRDTFGTGSTYAYSFRKAESKKAEPYQSEAYKTESYKTESYKTEMPKVQEKPKKKKKSSGTGKKFLVCIGLALVFGLVAGGVFVGVSAAGIHMLGLNVVEEDPETEVPKVDTVAPVGENTADEQEASATALGNLTVAQVAERCMPAMVAITNKSITEVPNYFGFGSQNYESTSSGSGIIVDQNDQELLIATNNHVISGATTLTVCFVDETLVEATIKGSDAENDLAIISVKLSDIPSETLSAIKVIQIGDSDELAVGDQVVAIGNALGYGQSVSSGWVSAMNREVVIDNITLSLIQTDAAINPGNSGGALLNMKGELIGINESKYSDTSVEGMGYAIPVSTATPILSELMSKETRYKVDEQNASYIGITCKDISSDFAEMYGVPTGVYVDSVEENGPAAQAGIKKGDIITNFDGTKLSSYTDLVAQLEYYAAGEIVEMTISRADNGEYKEQTVLVTLGSANNTTFFEQAEQ